MAELRYDETGNVVLQGERLPERIGEIGRVRDPWADRVTAQVTPESLTRLLRLSAELSEQMAFIKLMLRDPQIATCLRNLSMSVSRLPIKVKPFDEKSRAAKKRAEDDERVLRRPWMQKLVRRLVYGELYSFVGAELVFDDEFRPVDYDVVNPPRWTWSREHNQLRLRTLRAPEGEAIPDRRGFVIHSSALEPGTLRDGGLWWKVAWPWMFKTSAWSWLMRFGNQFGMPWIWAFIDRIEDRDAVMETLTEMQSNARAGFPKGTEVQLKEPQRYGSVHVFDAILNRSDHYITKLIMGHWLNTDAESGAGQLAGGAAADVSQENKEGVAEGITETVQYQIVEPYSEWQYGEKAVENEEISRFEIECTRPGETESRARTLVAINPVLQAAGQTIDPGETANEFNVKTVPYAPAAGDDDKNRESDVARAADAGGKPAPPPKVRTLEDATAVAGEMLREAGRRQTRAVTELAAEMAAGGASIAEFRAALLERYDAIDASTAGELTAQGLVVAEAMGRAGEIVKPRKPKKRGRR